MMTIVPSYGRDYKSQKDVLKDWNSNKDFTIRDMSSQWDGKQINKSDASNGNVQVMIRYSRLMKIVIPK